MPDFLQTKQNTSKLSNIFSDRKRFSIIVLVILLFAIPLTVWLAQNPQIFRPRAAAAPIELVTGQNSCVVSATDNTVSCASFPIRLTSPLETESTSSPAASFSPQPSGSSSPVPSPSPSSSPSSSASIVPSPSPSASPVACTNLVKNGGFENPVVTNSLGWTIYGATADLAAQDSRATTQNIADWNGRTGSSKYQVELQKSLFAYL